MGILFELSVDQLYPVSVRCLTKYMVINLKSEKYGNFLNSWLNIYMEVMTIR